MTARATGAREQRGTMNEAAARIVIADRRCMVVPRKGQVVHRLLLAQLESIVALIIRLAQITTTDEVMAAVCRTTQIVANLIDQTTALPHDVMSEEAATTMIETGGIDTTRTVRWVAVDRGNMMSDRGSTRVKIA